MGEIRGFIYKVAITLVLLSLLVPGAQLYAEGKEQVNTITEWQMLWEKPGEEMTIEQVTSLGDQGGWFPVKAGEEYPVVPDNIKTVWIKFQLPELTQLRPALEIKKLYAKNVVIYLDKDVIYERKRDYYYDLNEIVLPISKSESGQYLYFKLEKHIERVGLKEQIYINEYSELTKSDIRNDLIDVVLGAALIFIAFFMMVSVLFLKKSFLPGWNSLFLVMLSIGLMILTYSNFLDKNFPEFGAVFYILFDIASSILLPSLFFFFERMFGRGPWGLISKFKTIQIYFALFYSMMFILSYFSPLISDLYINFGFIFFGISMICGNILLIAALIYQCRKGNKEAIILSVGISIFAGVSLIEILWYFYNQKIYIMFFWKISILFFLASLIIIVVRRVMLNYEQAIQYSKQIEIFNNELQRSEKIELISHLAASIAHEVRNPLQVTRGFLQLLGTKSKEVKERSYMTLAIDELDRASEIITDFLTFAKPDMGDVMHLNLSEEIQKIVAILAPLATMSGGSIKMSIDSDLVVKGNSSRFKQALINIIKNSIEAFGENGEVQITATRTSNNSLILKIKDNGEGIDPEDLKRLGEPYYSKKTKGTGLGLMVTYRIIEAMNGEVKFYSDKGSGTEVCITMPVVS
ncbi:ATP-binding protein [Paenibacillus sp. NPDC057967]|uniref:ATP-binding protein n=1 Tax=Paenibacillus sp. NPDC057967 TaxID=3346293 RepID=UPI0036DEC68F